MNEKVTETEKAAERFVGLLNYVDALVKLDERVPHRLSQHKLPDGSSFVVHEHEVAKLPGVSLNKTDDEGPVWLRIQRLQRTAPPAVPENLEAWVTGSDDPVEPPTANETVHERISQSTKDELVAASRLRMEDCSAVVSIELGAASKQAEPLFDVFFRLDDQPEMKAAVSRYINDTWATWAERESPRRQSIYAYQKLFDLAQRLSQSGASESIEVIWAIGHAKWRKNGIEIDLPLIELGVELEVSDDKGADVLIRPRHVSPNVSLRAFDNLAEDQVQLAEQACQQALLIVERDEPEGMSPFRPESFASVLKRCGGQLDNDFEYLPESRRGLARNLQPPDPAGEHLLLNDRWVVYARRRSINAVLRDIVRLKNEVAPEEGTSTDITGAARTLIMGARDEPAGVFEPLGPKITGNLAAETVSEPIDPDHGDLFFPKAFNEDQVQIIRRLEKADGIVVQGPPGTGKTHTIANIISHMLATGKRVLVVSHGETALRVVREHLPEGIRDLAISVTTSEREGSKQIEKAVQLMLEVVNRVTANMPKQRALVAELSKKIIVARQRIQLLDEQIEKLAEVHLKHVPGTELTTFDLAKQLMESKERLEWFVDRPTQSFADAGLSNEAIAKLKAARHVIGADLDYLGKAVPDVAILPSAAELASWHLDLREVSDLSAVTSEYDQQVKKVLAHLGPGKAGELASTLEMLAQGLRTNASEPWAAELVRRYMARDERMRKANPLLFDFVKAVRDYLRSNQPFFARPVSCPASAMTDPTATVWTALCEGKNPFGLMAFGNRAHKPHFDQVKVAGRVPATSEDWQHAFKYVQLRRRMPELRARWHALRELLALPSSIDFAEDSIAELDTLLVQLESLTGDIPNRLATVQNALNDALRNRTEATKLTADQSIIEGLSDALSRTVRTVRLSEIKDRIKALRATLTEDGLRCVADAQRIIEEDLGSSDLTAEEIEQRWAALREEFVRLHHLAPYFTNLVSGARLVAGGGATAWSKRLLSIPASEGSDPCLPGDHEAAWAWGHSMGYLETAGSVRRLEQLHRERSDTEKRLRETFAELVKQQTFYNLSTLMTNAHKTALGIFADIINRIGAGTGSRAVLFRRDAREAMENCYDAVPCWIMPAWRVSEQLPSKLNSFDLVILDEASQSDAKDLPAILRGKKLLVVGDDKQVSPTAAFVSLANIRRLRNNHLRNLPYRTQIEPGGSLYDLAKVMFPGNFVMLKEHFRCVEPIIRFSTRFYTQPLIPLRVPTASERMDPPLIDIFVRDGRRRGKTKINPREAEVIVDEIAALLADSGQATVAGSGRPRTIGVISLIGAPQAALIQRQLLERLGEETFIRHQIVCGDSATLQGNERDIVFLSMIADPHNKQSQTAQQYAQRFNVALSRARDRMYLVRSVALEHLNPKDLKAKVIQHFREPMPTSADRTGNLLELCESGFERDMFNQLTSRGYKVTPQVGSQGYFIDLVVEGEGGRRLAIECDGDAYHGPDRWQDDMRRQRTLERVGWTFWRCFGSDFTLDTAAVMDDLVATLQRMEITPIGAQESAYVYTEHREVGDDVLDEGSEQNEGGDSVTIALEEPAPKTSFAIGDRVVVRLSDTDTERTLSFEIVSGPDDIENGVSNIESEFVRALSSIEPDEEMTVTISGVDTNLFFVRHELAAAAAA